MKIWDETIKRPVEVEHWDCVIRPCYKSRMLGSTSIYDGFKADWICDTRHLKGCPGKKDKEDD